MDTDTLLRDLNIFLPTWNEEIWGPLQAGRFVEMGENLRVFLSGLRADEWQGVHWEGLMNGIPALRGDIDEATWRTAVAPKIGEAILEAASPQKISAMYASIREDVLIKFHDFIVASVPGTTPEKKLAWLKGGALATLRFFLANPLGLYMKQSDFLNDQRVARLKTTPENLKEVMFSAQTAETVGRVAEQNNVPEEKISSVAEAAGLVLLGLIHPEELPDEIGKRAGLPAPAAKSISDSLYNRILSSIRPDLDKVYAPLPHEHEISEAQPPMPASLEEIKKPATGGPPPPPTIPFTNVSPPPKPFAVPTPPPPASRPAVGPVGGSVGEFARLGLDRERETPKPAPPAPPRFPQQFSPVSLETQRGEVLAEQTKPLDTVQGKPPAESAPTMIHEESLIKPLRSASGFRLDIPLPKLSEMKTDKGPLPVKPAVLELGGTPPPPPKAEAPRPPRVVHYTEFRTPLAEEKIADKETAPDKAPEHEIREITASPPPPPNSELPRPRIEPPPIRKSEPPPPADTREAPPKPLQ